MAIRRRRLAREVVGVSRQSSRLVQARRRGAIDRGSTLAEEAVRDATVVILATPVDAIVPSARRIARFMRPGSLLTDVGSTKASIVLSLERTLPPGIAFVGAHPLTGSEQQGIAAARADLFDESVCIVTATRWTNRRALRFLTRLWKPLVHRVVVMDPQAHDRLLAQVSHLPHLVAFCLVGATNHGALALAPQSFLDATRVAKSDPDLWDDILLSNRAALLRAIDRFDRRWHGLRTHLVHRDRAALRRFLSRAQSLRHALHER